MVIKPIKTELVCQRSVTLVTQRQQLHSRRDLRTLIAEMSLQMMASEVFLPRLLATTAGKPTNRDTFLYRGPIGGRRHSNQEVRDDTAGTYYIISENRPIFELLMPTVIF